VSVFDHSTRLKDCILGALVGDEIGKGAFRTVYPVTDELVLKVETSSRSFCNEHEWSIWQEVEGGMWAKWLAPCVSIDEFGAALTMRRTTPMTDRQWAALKQVPNFLCDLKQANWGMLNGKPVCHDYGNHRFLRNGISAARLVKRRDV
jgi:hypothetical protein